MNKKQYDIVKGAMEKTTKRIAIMYGEYVDANAVRNGYHEWTVGCGSSKQHYTSEELYDKFYNEIIKPTCKNVNPDVSANSIQTEHQQ